MGGEDAPDRAGPDPVPEAEQFALDASMSPAGVLSRQPKNQVPEFIADARSAGPVRIRPMALEQAPMPRQQR